MFKTIATNHKELGWETLESFNFSDLNDSSTSLSSSSESGLLINNSLLSNKEISVHIDGMERKCTVGKLIGNGGFGNVYDCELSPSEKRWALKQAKERCGSFERECRIALTMSEYKLGPESYKVQIGDSTGLVMEKVRPLNILINDLEENRSEEKITLSLLSNLLDCQQKIMRLNYVDVDIKQGHFALTEGETIVRIDFGAMANLDSIKTEDIQTLLKSKGTAGCSLIHLLDSAPNIERLSDLDKMKIKLSEAYSVLSTVLGLLCNIQPSKEWKALYKLANKEEEPFKDEEQEAVEKIFGLGEHSNSQKTEFISARQLYNPQKSPHLSKEITKEVHQRLFNTVLSSIQTIFVTSNNLKDMSLDQISSIIEDAYTSIETLIKHEARSESPADSGVDL